MLLTNEQREVIEDWFTDITDSGSVFDDVLISQDELEQRFFCTTPLEVLAMDFPNCTTGPYCVLSFDAYRGFTHVHFYTGHLQAVHDNKDFPYVR